MQGNNIETPAEILAEYRLGKCEKTRAPSGAEGDNWYTYTIERNRSPNIVGNRRGTLEQVLEYLGAFIVRINTRHGKAGYSPWATRRAGKQTAK